MLAILSLSPEQIIGIVSAISAAIVAIITAIGTAVNSNRRKIHANPKCCITGRALKPRKKKEPKKKS